MKFNKLRLLGFKSFVEPTEFQIEQGLTGVVGPNGCGKSNLVEALRWVMGENSYKNMRASGMDDVIFSGSGSRPSRNTAEVGLFLDNSDRSAPAAFNDADELQVSRRIERESGSVYRINGKDVRAKDVQLLFADASTGARSPSMVGQGRIGELISAKPQARRALLEEAAGISGLHSRRHEAELRLRAAETNLERLEDVIGQLESQLESLKRQARQANRYRSIASDIRKTEALLFHIKWQAAKQAETDALSNHNKSVEEIGKKATVQAQAAKHQALCSHRLPPLRDKEAGAAASLQRLTIERDQIDAEVARIAARRSDLQNRVDQLAGDIEREENAQGDHADMLERLNNEEAELKAQSQNTQNNEQAIKQKLEAASEKLGATEASFADLTAKLAQESARKSQAEQALDTLQSRADRLASESTNSTSELEDVLAEISKLPGPGAFQVKVDELATLAQEKETAVQEAEDYTKTALHQEQEIQPALKEAQADLNRIESEANTLAKIINAGSNDLFAAIIDTIKVAPGFETALGAALGEGLDLPTDENAPAHWKLIEPGSGDTPLPSSVVALSDHVEAPAQLHRALSQIGVVTDDEGRQLQKHLAPGQCLVSRKGAIWRWDGYSASAEAPTAAAQKLAQKNRLVEIDREVVLATKKVRELEGRSNDLKSRAQLARITESENREAWRELQNQLMKARDDLASAERAVGQFASRRSVLEEATTRLQKEIAENSEALERASTEIRSSEDLKNLEESLSQLRLELAQDRATMAEARAASEGMSREAEARGRRLETIIAERNSWNTRLKGSQGQVAELVKRRDVAKKDLIAIDEAPEEAASRRASLASQIDAAEQARKQAADELAVGENELAQADNSAKQALLDLSQSRELGARAEERANAAKERRSDIEERIVEELECQPHETAKLAELENSDNLPVIDVVERKLEKLKGERERLGAVNLRAETEQSEISEQRDALVSERDDLIEAIRRLRQGIASLNKEGRERLLEAFDVVNEHFKRLFTHLFGGGTAELQLIESDDPLEAGLEILARPPGKKPQTMTLLSGGEQALTAMALIFAVFLTNPAPICVLDEVDAPLDDHNVERFCNLMDEMSQSTDTRFVIITHNPITMARVNRLFGVTMAERGVSQLVSVDLEEAEKLRDAG